MLPRSSFADDVIDSFPFFLFGRLDRVLQQPPFQFLAVEIDVFAVRFEMGYPPAVGELVHVGLRQPREFARFGEVQDGLLSPKQAFDAVEPLLDGCVFTHNHSVLAFISCTFSRLGRARASTSLRLAYRKSSVKALRNARDVITSAKKV